MGIDNKNWNKPALQGDVAGLAINVAIALRNINECLEAIQGGKAVSSENIQKIEEIRKDVREIFDTLSGWTPEDDQR